ncbi:MAG: hypothetical protein JXA68_02670 [Ignavibacteriales bacterium]|nr:hypothetical protein [Ignavibacteriales bacterium]
MRKIWFFWFISFLITIAVLFYQRVTGPTHPISDEIKSGDVIISYTFNRSGTTGNDEKISIRLNKQNVTGYLYWKRFKMNEEWVIIEMRQKGGELYASLPSQPPAGKLEYFVELKFNDKTIILPDSNTCVIRFKGNIPIIILIPHVIAMFFAFLLSTRTGMEFFNPKPNIKVLTLWTLAFLIIGGFILGPLMQYFAFGEFWTGFPLGYDLTDNKTLLIFIIWIVAFLFIKKNKHSKRWALTAAIILLIIYLIPHSLLGSELDYSKIDEQKNLIENSIN